VGKSDGRRDGREWERVMEGGMGREWERVMEGGMGGSAEEGWKVGMGGGEVEWEGGRRRWEGVAKERWEREGCILF
jgi:hypothetical protein